MEVGEALAFDFVALSKKYPKVSSSMGLLIQWKKKGFELVYWSKWGKKQPQHPLACLQHPLASLRAVLKLQPHHHSKCSYFHWKGIVVIGMKVYCRHYHFNGIRHTKTILLFSPGPVWLCIGNAELRSQHHASDPRRFLVFLLAWA